MAGNAATAAAPVAPVAPAVPAEAAAPVPLDGYLHARAAGALGFGPLGEVLIRSPFGDREQLHLLGREGGARRQLTFGADPVAWARFSSDRERNAIAYLRDHEGDGNFQLYYQHADRPLAQRVSDGTGPVRWPVWSSAGRELAYTRRAADGAGAEIVVVDPEAGAAARVVAGGDGADWRALDWAGDDHLLLALQPVAAASGRLVLVDRVTGQRRPLDLGAGSALVRDARLEADGQGVYYIADGYGEFAQLRHINLVSGEITVVAEPATGDVGELALARDGHFLAWTVREEAGDRLNLVDLVTRQDLTPPSLPSPARVTELAFDAYSQHLLFTLATPRQPGDAWVLDIAANQAAAWTHSEAGPVDATQFVTPRLVRIPTFDRDGTHSRTIPAYLYEPAAAAGVRHPLLLELAADPRDPWRLGYEPWIQYLVRELGVAVLVPNLRGSSGFGRSWHAAGRGALREDAVKDIGAVLAWVRGQRSMDAQRVTACGEGLGGTLAVDALATYPDRLRGAIALGAISDIVGWLADADATVQSAWRAEFGDEREWQARAALRRLSPLANIERVSRPLLVAHGRTDHEVPIAQSEDLVAAARSHNVPVTWIALDDDGHGLNRTAGREAFLRAVAQFVAANPAEASGRP
jgi:dipeptidyl aminopeptidase/acylaminoacyl peptidase